MDRLVNIWNIIGKYKYLIAVVVFGVIMGFVDENSFVRRVHYAREINTLNQEIEYYRRAYEESTKRINELVSNPEVIERIAREKYRMKKPNEDVYVFEND
jgi:cell division protein FtsB